jgi:hypothetical protein
MSQAALRSGDLESWSAAIRERLLAEDESVRAVQASYDQIWTGSFGQRIVFFTWSREEAGRVVDGFGYAIVEYTGGDRWRATHVTTAVSDPPPPLIAYASERFADHLIVYGRIFDPRVQFLNVEFDTGKTRSITGYGPPPFGIAAVERYAGGVRAVDVQGENMQPITRIELPRLLSAGDEP